MRKIIICSSLFYANYIFSFCFEDAGRYFNINPNLLRAISFTESRFDPNAINHNKDKNNKIVSTDHGLMQINSWWFSYFESKGVKAKEIINQPCINVLVGAYILNQNFKQAGKNWYAVGAYNTGFRKYKAINKKRERYINLVKENFNEINHE